MGLASAATCRVPTRGAARRRAGDLRSRRRPRAVDAAGLQLETFARGGSLFLKDWKMGRRKWLLGAKAVGGSSFPTRVLCDLAGNGRGNERRCRPRSTQRGAFLSALRDNDEERSEMRCLL